MAKTKKPELTLEEKLEQALVPEDEQPYQVPGNWVWVKLGNQLKELESGFACAKRNELPSGTENAYPHLRPNNIGYFGKFNFAKVVHIPLGMVEIGKSTLEKGDILFNNTNSVELVGRCVCVHEHRNAAFSNHITRLQVLKNAPILPEFIALFINIRWGEGYFANICKKWVGQAGVNKDNLLILPIPLPSLAEQQRIVDRIESLFAQLDQAKELAQDALYTFETRKAAILHKAFTGELTAKWREKNGAGMESWEEKRFGDIAEIKSNLVDPKDYLTYPHIAPDNIERRSGVLLDYRTIEEDGVMSGKHRFFAGQILYSKIRPYLSKVVIVDFDGLCSADMYPIEAKGDTKYLWYYMLSDEFLEQASSAGSRSVLPKINQKELSVLTVRVPTLPEQQEIVRILDSLFEKEQKAKKLCDVIDKIDLMKKAILAGAFRGELGTNDPSEESAVELLKECLGQPSNLLPPSREERK